LYRGYVGSYTREYEEGDLIDIKVFKDAPDVLFDDDDGTFFVLFATFFYVIFVWSLLMVFDTVLHNRSKKEISNKQIYMATKDSDIIAAAILFATMTFMRALQIWLYPQFLKTGFDLWINGILAAVTVILWAVLIVRVRKYSVSNYTLVTDVCLEKHKHESDDSIVYSTCFNCGESKRSDVYENVEKGQSCYVLTSPKGKILAAYDIAKWGSPSFTANDFDYKREYCKELFSALLFSAIAALAFTALIAVARASITL